MDAIEFGKSIGILVRNAVAKGLVEVLRRLGEAEAAIAQLKDRPAPKDGEDGKSVTLEDVRPLIDEAVKALPPAEPGKAGTSVTVDQVLPELREQVADFLKALPVPQDGQSVTLEEVLQALLPGVEKSLGAMHDRWALDFERRAQGVLERAVDRIPKPKDGEDGVDGLGFDDMTVEHDGERGFTLRFQRAEQVKEFAFSVPVVIDRGYWKEGLAVAKGDGLTFGGSYWIAQADTATKPDIGNPDWRLAVKKGRDGKA